MTTMPVIVGTDGSAGSMRAVEWAAKEVRLRGAPLRIVSAAEAVTRDAQGSLEAAARRAAEIAPDMAIDTGLLAGPTAVAVAVAGCGAGAQLLVVGTRGGGAFTAMVLGSVSRYAAMHAECPVVVVREETMAAHRQVVVGIRDAGDCDAALTFAFEEAGMRKASLLAVHAWQSPVSFSDLAADEAAVPSPHAAEVKATMALATLLAAWQAKYPDVIVDQDVVQGHPGRVLAGYSARADLVVLGRRGEHGVRKVTHAVLSHAHGPVATVPSA